MTNEEVIAVLKPFMACMFDQHGCPISDAAIALDLAIAEPDESAGLRGEIQMLTDRIEVLETENELLRQTIVNMAMSMYP